MGARESEEERNLEARLLFRCQSSRLRRGAPALGEALLLRGRWRRRALTLAATSVRMGAGNEDRRRCDPVTRE